MVSRPCQPDLGMGGVVIDDEMDWRVHLDMTQERLGDDGGFAFVDRERMGADVIVGNPLDIACPIGSMGALQGLDLGFLINRIQGD